MKTFLEFLIEQLEEAFVSGGKKYTFGFGNYYCDGKKISKEEYYAAKPKDGKQKSSKKKSEEIQDKKISSDDYKTPTNLEDISYNDYLIVSGFEYAKKYKNSDTLVPLDYKENNELQSTFKSLLNVGKSSSVGEKSKEIFNVLKDLKPGTVINHQGFCVQKKNVFYRGGERSGISDSVQNILLKINNDEWKFLNNSGKNVSDKEVANILTFKKYQKEVGTLDSVETDIIRVGNISFKDEKNKEISKEKTSDKNKSSDKIKSFDEVDKELKDKIKNTLNQITNGSCYISDNTIEIYYKDPEMWDKPWVYKKFEQMLDHLYAHYGMNFDFKLKDNNGSSRTNTAILKLK